VLIEHADEARSEALAAALRRSGFAVTICPGPTPSDRCPLAGDAGCAAAVGADAVLSGLGLGTPEAREALAALRVHAPRTPLLVEADAAAAARWPELLDGCDLVAPSATPAQLVERLRAMIEGAVPGAA
jgi:hypothetical protein